MLIVIFCTGCLILLSLTKGVSGQKIILDRFNKSLTHSSCPAPGVIIAGERIVLTARLNSSNTDQSNWPLTGILLKTWGTYTAGWVTICRINIKEHGCYGYRADMCGYCDRHEEDSVYHLVFNVTSVITEGWFLATWTGSASNVSSSNAYVSIQGDPYATTLANIGRQYQAQDITREALVPYSDNYDVRTVFYNAQPSNNCTWGFAGQPLNQTNCYSQINYDLSDWEDHIDDQVNIHFQDTCQRTWSLAIPVTDLPQLDCDLHTVTKSNSTGTQIVLTCSFPPFLEPDYVYCYIYDQFYGYVERIITKNSGSVTCVTSLSAAQMNTSRRATLYFSVRFPLDVQFTNGTGQTPRVVRFQVNGSSSVTVNPGSNVTLECKVYGNPPATAVIVGPARGRVQEHRAPSDLLQLTLANVQCSDTGRYACLGVSILGTTSSERRGYLDVNVRCPVQIESYLPNSKDQKFNFDPESDVLITFKVYGYPAPADLGLRLQQGTSWLNVSMEFYSCTYVSLNPSRGLVNLLVSRGQATNNQVYLLTMANGNPGSQEFRFQLVAESPDWQSADQPSPWLYAFIAVTCVLCVVLVAVIIVVIYCRQKRQDHLQPSTPAPSSGTERDPGLICQPGPGVGKPEDYDEPGPRDTARGTHEMYQQPTRSIPVRAPRSRDRGAADEVYVNAGLDNIYELTD